MKSKRILYIGGFELPDRNAAAQRVVGIAKGYRDLGYTVEFINLIKERVSGEEEKKEYFGFTCYEYTKEEDIDYLCTAKSCISRIGIIEPDIIIAYNYPGIALERIRNYCKKRGIKCIADVTEWYKCDMNNPVFWVIKSFDTFFRMRFVHHKMDGIIAISRYLYNYYCKDNNAVLIPPTIDITDEKWKKDNRDKKHVAEVDKTTTLIYAGSPSMQKERLDVIVNAIESIGMKKIHIDILGITREEFIQIYQWKLPLSERVSFFGRVSHRQAIEQTKNSDWTVIIRDNNFVVNAGFPTKFVEAISCGTPVIINRFSNIVDYATSENTIIVDNYANLKEAILRACGMSPIIENTTFDYHHYLNELQQLINRMQ